MYEGAGSQGPSDNVVCKDEGQSSCVIVMCLFETPRRFLKGLSPKVVFAKTQGSDEGKDRATQSIRFDYTTWIRASPPAFEAIAGCFPSAHMLGINSW